jgi:hypothetical protein
MSMAGSDMGVYRGAAVSIVPVRACENFLGMPSGTTVSYVLAFMADSPSWSQFEQAILEASTNGPPGTASATAWAPLLGSRQLMLAVPACCQGTTSPEAACAARRLTASLHSDSSGASDPAPRPTPDKPGHRAALAMHRPGVATVPAEDPLLCQTPTMSTGA